MDVKLGDLILRHGLCLAPMAGFTDRAMRRICHDFGAEYSVTEMVSAKATVFGDKKTFNLAKIEEDEGPVALQIFGSEPDVMARAAEILSSPREGVRPVAIDINMGCPVNKIFSNGEGSALMKNPHLIEEIVRKTASATDLPVTVKIRTGIDEKSINAVECAIAAESGGATLVCVHGRTRVQMYGGSVNRDVIRKVKESLKIPVIANGDITCAEDAVQMLEYTGADGVAIGRGAVGNPFIFSEIADMIEGRNTTPRTLEERIDTALLQLSLAIEDKGERVAVPESRKQIALYFRSFRGAAQLRAKINLATTFEQVRTALITTLT